MPISFNGNSNTEYVGLGSATPTALVNKCLATMRLKLVRSTTTSTTSPAPPPTPLCCPLPPPCPLCPPFKELRDKLSCDILEGSLSMVRKNFHAIYDALHSTGISTYSRKMPLLSWLWTVRQEQSGTLHHRPQTFVTLLSMLLLLLF